MRTPSVAYGTAAVPLRRPKISGACNTKRPGTLGQPWLVAQPGPIVAHGQILRQLNRYAAASVLLRELPEGRWFPDPLASAEPAPRLRDRLGRHVVERAEWQCAVRPSQRQSCADPRVAGEQLPGPGTQPQE